MDSSRDDSGARNDYWRGGAGGSEGRRGRGGGGRGSYARRRATAERPEPRRARARPGRRQKRATATHAVVSNRPAEAGTRPHTRAPTGATAAAAAAAAAAAVAAATSSRALLSPRNAKTRCGSTPGTLRRARAATRFWSTRRARAHVHGGELLDGDSQAREAEPLRARPPHETRGAFDRRPAVRRFRNGTRGVPGAVRVPRRDDAPERRRVPRRLGARARCPARCGASPTAAGPRRCGTPVSRRTPPEARSARTARSSSPICCAKSPPSTATRFRRRICQTGVGAGEMHSGRRVRVTPRFLPMPNAIGVRSRT